MAPTAMKAVVTLKGGPGSGHRGHAGREGKRGGSLPGSGVSQSFRPGSPVPKGSLENDERAQALFHIGVPEGWILAKEHTRQQVKDQIVTNISKESGVEYAKVNEMIGKWADTSNDNDGKALSMQQAASEEFDVSLSDWQQGKIDRRATQIQLFGEGPGDRPILPRDQERSVLRTMYNQTQETLASAGYKPGDTIRLYRGYDFGTTPPSKGTVMNYQGNAMESWSFSLAIARTFAESKSLDSIVVGMDVPIENVIGCAKSGFGCLNEGEFVIVGSIPGNTVRILSR